MAITCPVCNNEQIRVTGLGVVNASHISRADFGLLLVPLKCTKCGHEFTMVERRPVPPADLPLAHSGGT